MSSQRTDAIRTVTVFCGSSPGSSPAFTTHAEALGAEIANRGLRLVYGGASVGTMGSLADAALEAGGHVTGIIPRNLAGREVAHTGLSRLKIVGDMLERKRQMASLADAYVVLPGGLGTLDELFEVLTATQLGLDPKPCAILNLDGFYEDLLRFLQHVENAGFARETERLFTTGTTAPEVIDQLLSSPLAAPRQS